MSAKIKALNDGIQKFSLESTKIANQILNDLPQEIDAKKLSDKLTEIISEYHKKLMEKYNRS